MARKRAKLTGGSRTRQKRGLRIIAAPVTAQVREAVHIAAGLADEYMGVWSAKELESAARRVLKAHGLTWPGEEESR